MTMSPVQVERKVRQLDNDVQSLYDLLNAVSTTQQRHTNRLLELAGKADIIDGKVDALDAKVSTLDTRVAGLESKVDTLDTRVAGLETALRDAIDGKVDTVLELLQRRTG